MSWKLQDQVWEMALPSTGKLVLLALANRAGASGSCYPSVSDLSVQTGLDVKTVRKAILFLEKEELIYVERRERRSSVFQLSSTKFTLELPPDLVVPKTVVPPKTVLPNLDGGTTKFGSELLPNLVPEHINNKSYNKSDIYIADQNDIFDSVENQISDLQADHSIDLQDDPSRVLTAIEMRSLARLNRINLNCTERLKQVANRQSVTTEIFLECVKEYQKTPRSPGWLVGMLDNVSRDANKFLTQVRERNRPNAFVQDLIDSGLL